MKPALNWACWAKLDIWRVCKIFDSYRGSVSTLYHHWGWRCFLTSCRLEGAGRHTCDNFILNCYDHLSLLLQWVLSCQPYQWWWEWWDVAKPSTNCQHQPVCKPEQNIFLLVGKVHLTCWVEGAWPCTVDKLCLSEESNSHILIPDSFTA